VQFFSTRPGSGNNMAWRIRLPQQDPVPTQSGSSVATFELTRGFVFGLALCDPLSNPQQPCTPDSDSNTSLIVPTDAGVQAFMSITADFAKGSSGCPVLDERGAVIGIVNNTESIYYDDDGHRKQLDLQMVVKNATPSWAILPLIEGPVKTAAGSPTPASTP